MGGHLLVNHDFAMRCAFRSDRTRVRRSPHRSTSDFPNSFQPSHSEERKAFCISKLRNLRRFSMSLAGHPRTRFSTLAISTPRLSSSLGGGRCDSRHFLSQRHGSSRFLCEQRKRREVAVKTKHEQKTTTDLRLKNLMMSVPKPA